MPDDAAMRPEPVPDDVLACCSTLYGHPLAVALMGEFFHPGGSRMTRALLDALAPHPGERVLDVAAGRGATSRLLAERYACRVVAVEQSPQLVAAAGTAAAEAGLGDRVEIVQADAVSLPLPARSVDVVVCECALCTFADQRTAVAEWRRVLRPAGRVGLADVTRQGELPAGLNSALARAACLSGARSQEGYRRLLQAEGFEVTHVQACDETLRELADSIRDKLLAAQILQRIGKWTPPPGTLEHAGELLRQARAAIADRRLGYSLFVGRLSPTGAGA